MPILDEPDAATLFAALGDGVRLSLLAQIGVGERSIRELSEGRPLSRQAVTKHLHQLERAGLVRSGRLGREARYRVEQQRLNAAARFLAQVSAQWDDALGRLADHISRAEP